MLLYNFLFIIGLLVLYTVYRALTWPTPPLAVVDNKYVSVKLITKLNYDFRIGSLTPSSTLITTNKVEARAITQAPAKSGTFSCEKRKVFLYNPGPESFNIKGLSYFTVPRRTSTTTPIIGAIYRKHGDTDIKNERMYKGESIEILSNYEIEITGINDVLLQRLLISINNAKPRPITLYVLNTETNMYYSSTITDLTDGYLIIDLYE